MIKNCGISFFSSLCVMQTCVITRNCSILYCLFNFYFIIFMCLQYFFTKNALCVVGVDKRSLVMLFCICSVHYCPLCHRYSASHDRCFDFIFWDWCNCWFQCTVLVDSNWEWHMGWNLDQSYWHCYYVVLQISQSFNFKCYQLGILHYIHNTGISRWDFLCYWITVIFFFSKSLPCINWHCLHSNIYKRHSLSTKFNTFSL